MLSTFQTQLNNSFNSTTRLTSNEIIYDFKIKDAVFLLTSINELIVDDISQKRLKYCNEIIEIYAFANVKTKLYYNTRYTFFLLNFENKIYLRLNHEYHLSKKLNRKLSSQRCNSFSIKRRVDKLVYELELSNNWKIHLVVFITQLKSYLFTQNSYQRSRSNNSKAIETKNNIFQYKSFEVNRIVSKKTRKYKSKKITQYLLKWKKYKTEHDKWKNIIKLRNCFDLIKKYEKKIQIEKTFQKINRFLISRQRFCFSFSSFDFVLLKSLFWRYCF